MFEEYQLRVKCVWVSVGYCVLLVLLRILLQTLASTNKEKERFEQELNHYKKKYEE